MSLLLLDRVDSSVNASLRGLNGFPASFVSRAAAARSSFAARFAARCAWRAAISARRLDARSDFFDGRAHSPVCNMEGGGRGVRGYGSRVCSHRNTISGWLIVQGRHACVVRAPHRELESAGELPCRAPHVRRLRGALSADFGMSKVDEKEIEISKKRTPPARGGSRPFYQAVGISLTPPRARAVRRTTP